MNNTANVHVFIALISDSYVRFSFQGASGEADGQAYCNSLPNVVTIDYMGALYDVSDMDKGDRKGVRVYRDSIIVSCKHIGCLRTCDEDKVHKETSMSRQRRGFNGVLHRQRSAMDEQNEELGN